MLPAGPELCNTYTEHFMVQSHGSTDMESPFPKMQEFSESCRARLCDKRFTMLSWLEGQISPVGGAVWIHKGPRPSSAGCSLQIIVGTLGFHFTFSECGRAAAALTGKCFLGRPASAETTDAPGHRKLLLCRMRNKSSMGPLESEVREGLHTRQRSAFCNPESDQTTRPARLRFPCSAPRTHSLSNTDQSYQATYFFATHPFEQQKETQIVSHYLEQTHGRHAFLGA